MRSRGVQWHENGDIQRARWIKPISRWSPAQTCGHVILSSTSPDTANEALAHSLFIFQKKVYAEKCKKEPLRCLKCHGWGHLASDCSAAFDTCSTCAQHHRMDTCKNTAHCVSCSTVGHASWARACPVFQRKCNKMNDCLEDNNMPYFPTAESWMQVREPPKVVYVILPLPWPAQRSRNNNGMTQSTLPWKTAGVSTRGAPPSSQQLPHGTTTVVLKGSPPQLIPMSSTPQPAPTRIKIWQQNLNKSRVAQEDLISSDVYRNHDVLALQEPYFDAYRNTKVTRDWRVVYPSSWLSNSSLPRVVMLISTSIDTNQWAQLHIPNMRDLITIWISDEFGKLTIFNLYNDCQNSDMIDALGEHLASQPQVPHPSHPVYSIWCGDFN